jgi:hypothetical protein
MTVHTTSCQRTAGRGAAQARARQVDPSTAAEVEHKLGRMAARRKAAEAKQRRDLSSFLDRRAPAAP